MTFDEALAYCRGLHRRGIRPGLDRLQAALRAAGDPERGLRVVHVAGTNGKGSTARMIQSILTAAGYRTGLYTSPAVTGLRDTVTIDGAPIPKRTFAALVARWQSLGKELTEFEFLTALTLEYFARERVDICVLECGMGGAGDATNVCPPPLAAVITPVALDHTAFLGDTVEQIAAEKCGIIKAPCGVITSPAQSPEALGVIYERAAAQGLTVYSPGRAAATRLPSPPGQTRFVYDNVAYTLPLGGVCQVDNALTALQTVRVLGEKGFAVDTAALVRGLAAATLPCRQEVIGESPLRLIDGAHNPHGIEALAQTLLPLSPVTLLCGMLRDKDTAAAAALLAPVTAGVICTTPPSERALSAEELAAQFRAAGVEQVQAVADPAAAWETARRLAGEAPLVVCGSFYTAAAIRPLMIKDKEKSRSQ